ncbi:MAG: hypothetical protein BGP06_14325 [Rhizobiales bacterium 65-9]|nr:transglycosylase SLT domain-containing protein [Hyphomicrobiales bacterium]OJY36846.1 MAG: hypothetical protein BGP06_14325 [Rhizobiales bacterium 65-9]
MARPLLISTMIVAAFGIGFAARQAGLVASPFGPEQRSDAAASGGGAPPQVTAEPAAAPTRQPVAASLAPSSRPFPDRSNAARQTAPPGTATPLAYAPILPEPATPFPRLTPPPDIPSFPQTTPARLPPPALAPFAAADIDAVRDVIAAMRKGDVDAADGLIAKRTDPTAKTLAEWTLMRSGLRNVSYDRIIAFMEKNADWPTQPLLQRRAEEALSAERKPPAVTLAFFAAREPMTAVGRIALARALVATKKHDEAAALIRTVWREDNLSATLEASVGAEFADLLRSEDHRARMERYIFKEEIAKALGAASRAGAGYEALVKARQAVEKKAANAKALLDAVPKQLHKDSSYLFARAQFARRANQAAEAAKAMEGAPRDPDILVDGDEWWVERRLIARKLLDAGDFKLAYKVAAEHGGETDAARVEAEFHAGWIALRFLNDPKLAAPHFAAAADAAKMPMSQSRALYWQGRAAEAAGDAAAAQGFYRKAAIHSGFFYGQLARAKLPDDLDIPVVTGAIAPRPATLENDRALRAVDLLLALGERDLAISMIYDLAARSGSEAQLAALGDLLAARGDARAVLLVGKLAMQRGVNIERHAFPTFGVPAYESLTDRVETPIVHAIARQESAFDPKAVSHAGARGLMQLMPATARVTANRFKAPFDLGRLTSDAAYNAQIGSAHLGDLLNDWGGSYILVFAAYNAGSQNVKKWIDAYGDPRDPSVDAIDWIERIPFTETRNYVQRVMENLQMYRSRLNPGGALMIASDLRRGALSAPVRKATIADDKPAAFGPR